MNRYIIWISGLLIILISACNKGSDTPITVIHDTTTQGGTTKYTEPKLIGKWRWLGSRAANSATVFTPEAVGYTAVVEFVNDSVYYGYKNDTLILNTKYVIIKGKSIYDREVEKMILLDRASFPISYLFPSTDTLILRQECVDCYIESFIKTSK